MGSALGALGLLGATLWPTVLGGQSSELSLELGGSRFRPPVGVEGSPASFVVAGIRGSWLLGFDSDLQGSILGGRSLDATASGDFVSGDVEASLWHALAGRWSVGSRLRAFAFDVGGAFPYRAGGLEGVAGLRLRTRSLAAEVTASGGWGRSRVELRRYAEGPTLLVTDDLWRYGGGMQFLLGRGSFGAGLTGGLHQSAGGLYRSVGGRIVLAPGTAALELRVDAWKTPVGTETTGGLALVLPLGGAWTVRGFAGRSEPDPLTLAEPGSGGGGLMVGRRVAGAPSVTAGSRLYEIRDETQEGSRVRFALHYPEAREVALLGDFTRWEPLPMSRDGHRWTLVLDVPEGVYHFGFLVDGTWYVPEDARDRVPDEWGRTSAILVVESSDPPGGEAPRRQGAG